MFAAAQYACVASYRPLRLFPNVLRGAARVNGCCSHAALWAGSATRRMSEVRLPPLRALDDFVLGSARLAAPDPGDPQRWCHRVINNLLYYQTNYLLCFGISLALAGYVRPLHTLLSALVVAVALGVLVWAAETRAAVRRCRRSHPAACLAAVLAISLIILWAVGGALTFLLSITAPVLLILLHASLRLRNLKNKIENKIESIGLKRTPMGLLLEALGQEQEAGS